jgi:cytidine deaminase
VVVQSHKDMNPLSPCGACTEWLKKIAQCNPYFKIITFTDANCNGMYISSCPD